ncbi:hypothetical protein BDZ91DRAFT_21798 [Kalaharituber pfeilii]|nr:hypothetical protein BDZ91DRAFT_21798 [Kalaharituber pfeilii]
MSPGSKLSHCSTTTVGGSEKYGPNQSTPTDRFTTNILEVKGGGQLLVGKEENGRLEGKGVVKGDELGLQKIQTIR